MLLTSATTPSTISARPAPTSACLPAWGDGALGIAFDTSGNLYVGNGNNGGSIHKFGPTGTDLGVFANTFDPENIAFDSSGNLYAASFNGNTIQKFGPTGTDLGVFAGRGLSGPVGMAFDRNGIMYVANQGDNTVHKFAPQELTSARSPAQD